MSLCLCFRLSIQSLSLSSLEFAPKPLTKPWLGFDHFPLLTLLSAMIPHSSLCLEIRPASFLLFYLREPFLNPLCILTFLCTPSSATDKRERDPSRNQKRRVSTGIPTHLVIAVSKPSDNSLNCHLSHYEIGEAMGIWKSNKKKAKRNENGSREGRHQAQTDVVAI